MSWQQEIGSRLARGEPIELEPEQLAIVGAVALAVVVIGPVWRVVRLGVTLVHELGHAGVGVLFGRTFTGFVLRGDASGHAVTRGPTRGLGLVATTWAGYPAPALLGAALAFVAGTGWAAATLAAMALILLLSLIRVRSVLTAVVTLGTLAGLGALWWWREDLLQVQVLTGLAAVLVVGAWRHVIVAAADHSPGNDARVLARLTPIPRVLWLLTFAAVCAFATWALLPL